ncbi:hypothetical protein [Anaerorudis cellulosivorans]|uniref:hypothetical protein n=1 Tax=Anaerorudis cellulosivorans TaxID=3397862 RepID=UPI0022202D69|nr:hypothetical protein [Seramator thermalis]MCW1735355.1 hypothetical protein [Seramator thermalis]
MPYNFLVVLRKKPSILPLFPAMVVLLIAGFIPHHHPEHGGICFIFSPAHVHAEHTHRHLPPSSSHDTCPAESVYMATSDSETKSWLFTSVTIDRFPFFEGLLSFFGQKQGPLFSSWKTISYPDYINLYRSAFKGRFGSLRSPPVSHSLFLS